MWRCKECSVYCPNRYELLKHLRLQHRHRQSYSCPHLNCPCSFKTLNALQIHLSRVHPKQACQEILELESFSCAQCSCKSLSNERDFFMHVGLHLKSHEIVTCMFRNCTFKTNIYGTFHSHKNRKHTPHTISDLKPGIVTTKNLFSQESSDANNDTLCPDDSAVGSISTSPCTDVDMRKTLTDVIEQNFASALLKLEHFAHVPGAKIDEFLEELHCLSSASHPLSVNIIETVLQKHGSTLDKLVIEEVATALSASHPLLKAIEKGGSLSTSYLRNKFYREHFNVIEPVEYVLDKRLSKSFQYVPILKTLQELFKIKHFVEKVVENHQIHKTSEETGVKVTYKSFYDGSHFKENYFLSCGELRILLTLYIDDFEVCNPLGTSRRKHKLCGIYWTLSNLHPASQSALSSIYLTIMCKSDDVKNYGYERIMQPLLQDVITLEEDGIFVPLLGKCVKGTIQVVAADNLSAHSLAGFNESFSAGNICRVCTATRSEIQVTDVRSGSFPLRTKDLHNSHVNSAHQNGSSCCGVKRQCVITKNLAHFSVQTGYPPDLMHDVFEGIVPVELAHCLSLMISKKYFTLDLLNKCILGFPYKWSDKTNKPCMIPHTFSKTIGGNAHENWALIRFLPFIIGHLVPEDEMAWQILMVLKDIIELLVAPVHTEDSIAYLESKISEHRKRYQDLFPNVQLFPKHHFLEHYPSVIRKFGPVVGLWTMRFEAKHSFFKHIIRLSNCFKNVPLSLSSKHQLMISYHMRASSFEKPILEMTNVSSVPVDVLERDIVQSIEQKCPGTIEVHMTRSVKTKGVSFKTGMLVVHGSNSGLPDFGKIVHIFIIQERLFFFTKRLCGWYSEHHRAFELTVCPTKARDLVELSDLADDYPLADYSVGSVRMVTLKRYVLV
ncbi:uncharacterized protein [Nothobranchius furzeri]|uniref:uncharacterized protein n=1 Tax=Nothobranchius furzeri TaxID=105023 RepID=UPI00390480BC